MSFNSSKEIITTFDVSILGSATYTSENNTLTTFVETPTIFTTNGTAVGVTQSGTSNHIVDILLLSIDASNDISIGTDGGLYVDVSALETTTSMVNLIAGNRIATYIDEATTSFDIDETITSMAQAAGTGIITFTAENANVSTANIISTDVDNAIGVGSDGGAYFNATGISIETISYIDPVSVLASSSIALPVGPQENEIFEVHFGGNIAFGQTVVNQFNFTGGTVLGNFPAEVSSGDSIVLRFRTSNSTWYIK